MGENSTSISSENIPKYRIALLVIAALIIVGFITLRLLFPPVQVISPESSLSPPTTELLTNVPQTSSSVVGELPRDRERELELADVPVLVIPPSTTVPATTTTEPRRRSLLVEGSCPIRSECVVPTTAPEPTVPPTTVTQMSPAPITEEEFYDLAMVQARQSRWANLYGMKEEMQLRILGGSASDKEILEFYIDNRDKNWIDNEPSECYNVLVEFIIDRDVRDGLSLELSGADKQEAEDYCSDNDID